MKTKIISTSVIALAFAMPAMADTYDTLSHDYANSCTVGKIGTYSGTTGIATANFTANTYNCTAGQYLAADAIACAACPEGSHCDSAATYTYNATTAQGAAACPNTHPSSASGASASTQCYRACATTDISHSTAVSGNMYYNGTSGDGTSACVATSCDSGYSVDSGVCVANTITVQWGDASGGVHATNQCTYDGTLTTPTTAPTKRGHTFTGWTFPKPTYDFSTLDPSIEGTDYTYNASAYTWVTQFSYGSVSGTALCSVTPGERATAGTPDETTTGNEAQYCWCKATGYTPANSGITYENTSSSAWVFLIDYGSASDCASDCAWRCGYDVRDFADFRRPVFGIQQ